MSMLKNTLGLNSLSQWLQLQQIAYTALCKEDTQPRLSLVPTPSGLHKRGALGQGKCCYTVSLAIDSYILIIIIYYYLVGIATLSRKRLRECCYAKLYCRVCIDLMA